MIIVSDGFCCFCLILILVSGVEFLNGELKFWIVVKMFLNEVDEDFLDLISV